MPFPQNIDYKRDSDFSCDDCTRVFLGRKVLFVDGEKRVDEDGFVHRNHGVAVCPHCFSDKINPK